MLRLVLLCICFLVLEYSSAAEDPACAPKLKLEVLPGRGWDNIRNKDMGQVLHLTYKECRSTEDGVYLIPDHVSTIPIKESNMDLTSELIEHYSNYTSATARSFTLEASASYYSASRSASVSGSFSMDYQNVKMKQVNDKSMTTRIQVRNTLYTVLAEPTAEIHPSLNQLLVEAGKEIEQNNTGKAQLMMELIIRDYGTHYLTYIDAGAILIQEDYVTTDFIQSLQANKNKLGVAASASLLGKFGFGVSYEQTDQTEMIKNYKSNVTSSSVRSIGGAPVEPNMTVQQWLNNTPNNLVTIDRSGEPLNYIITPQKFPEIDLFTLSTLRDLMEGAINDYYAFNTHSGCTKIDSPNFEFHANFDDRSCQSTFDAYTFGGVYQTCKLVTDGPKDLCSFVSQKNILTGDFSCPQDYSPVHLHSSTRSLPYGTKDCSDICATFLWIFKVCVPPKKCKTLMHEATVEYSTYWCYANTPPKPKTGLMFGGLYTALTQNPLTKSQNCPGTFVPRLAGFHLNICISNDYELDGPKAVPFGGFFSCSQGNPLVTKMDPSNGNVFRNPGDPYPHGCPGGYSQHMAAIDNGCEINYCVKANAYREFGLMPVVRPPFRNPSNLFLNMSMLSAVKPGHSSPEESSLSNEALTGIIVGSCLATILTVIIVVVVIKRNRRNKRENTAADRERVINDGHQYGTMQNAETAEA